MERMTSTQITIGHDLGKAAAEECTRVAIRKIDLCDHHLQGFLVAAHAAAALVGIAAHQLNPGGGMEKERVEEVLDFLRGIAVDTIPSLPPAHGGGR